MSVVYHCDKCATEIAFKDLRRLYLSDRASKAGEVGWYSRMRQFDVCAQCFDGFWHMIDGWGGC